MEQISLPPSFFLVINLPIIAIVAFLIFSLWKIFKKAGVSGWFALIPILNTYVYIKVAGRPGWWILLLIIPIVNLVVVFIVNIDLAKQFGKGVGFGIGLALLAIIFWPILAFGSAKYQGQKVEI
ncbi:MAG TPA: DUF5684 domain-containing protein [Bdellovibrionota bacterium]|nr:DUF5684 domain-containing protein [Bdellovibrionota bacterium]